MQVGTQNRSESLQMTEDTTTFTS